MISNYKTLTALCRLSLRGVYKNTSTSGSSDQHDGGSHPVVEAYTADQLAANLRKRKYMPKQNDVNTKPLPLYLKDQRNF